MIQKTYLRVAAALVLLTSALLVGFVMTKDRSAVPADEMSMSTAATGELHAAGTTRVFFGHQSVGGNVLHGLPRLYESRGLSVPEIVKLAEGGTVAPDVANGHPGFLAHAYIGENGDPLGKVRAFESMVRGGIGAQVEVAFMKLCYRDITRDTDVEAVFETYRDTMSALERDFPDVMFVHVTTPLTREADLKGRFKAVVKNVIGKEDVPAADHVARERYNALMRQEYSDDRLFDIAAVESTRPDGTTVDGSYQDGPYLALYEGYSSDSNGHLNDEGSMIAAAALVDAIARASEARRS